MKTRLLEMIGNYSQETTFFTITIIELNVACTLEPEQTFHIDSDLRQKIIGYYTFLKKFNCINEINYSK